MKSVFLQGFDKDDNVRANLVSPYFFFNQQRDSKINFIRSQSRTEWNVYRSSWFETIRTRIIILFFLRKEEVLFF